MYKIPESVLKALEILEKNNFEAYLVGGCVRDFLLGRIPYDYDITTNAVPSEIIEAFKGYRTIPTGIKHGTVTVIIDKVQIEITTYRKETTYSDNRHPDAVEFTSSLKEDLVRRDFSMNSIAMDLNYNIIDLYDGRSDMNNKVITCIENPDKRFEEDALRILRAMRFASQLDFSIEIRTSESIHRNAYRLKNISAERLNTELEKLLNGKNPYSILKEYEDVIKIFIPEYRYNDCVIKKDNDKKISPLIKRSAFFFNINPVYDIMKRLKYSNKDINNTLMLIKYFDSDIKNKADLKLILSEVGEELIYELINFMEVSERKSPEDLKYIKVMLDEVLKNNECYLISHLDINGNDLLNMGVSGKDIGRILNILLDKVIHEEFENNINVFKEFIKDAFL